MLPVESNNPHCRYCDGEGYLWRERIVKMIVFRGVAPVYKPGNLATGQYPQADYGYVSPDKTTAYCEYSVFPDYEKYTNDQKSRYDMLYELKVDARKDLHTRVLPVPGLLAAPTLCCRSGSGTLRFMQSQDGSS
jgi:hypothetical protein